MGKWERHTTIREASDKARERYPKSRGNGGGGDFAAYAHRDHYNKQQEIKKEHDESIDNIKKRWTDRQNKIDNFLSLGDHGYLNAGGDLQKMQRLSARIQNLEIVIEKIKLNMLSQSIEDKSTKYADLDKEYKNKEKRLNDIGNDYNELITESTKKFIENTGNIKKSIFSGVEHCYGIDRAKEVETILKCTDKHFDHERAEVFDLYLKVINCTKGLSLNDDDKARELQSCKELATEFKEKNRAYSGSERASLEINTQAASSLTTTPIGIESHEITRLIDNMSITDQQY